MSKLAIIVGSTRPKRFADHPAKWIHDHVANRGDVEVEMLDLRDYPMPFFNEPTSPAYAPPQNEVARRWQKKVGEVDGYIVVAAEYNRGPTAVLKNALDYAYQEYNNKPIAFVGYGGVGGARSIEHLRLSAIELQMAPIRTAVHIQMPVYMAVLKEGKSLHDFDFLNQSAGQMLDQLMWWVEALKAARNKG
ncbi:MAG TPA: NAD(P)H-dependent oxidoreductase [Geminicoccaceae bacterium]|nr:NAD(P)H-dependent oxidoreductase [Geminicoccaceae bacterium]